MAVLNTSCNLDCKMNPNIALAASTTTSNIIDVLINICLSLRFTVLFKNGVIMLPSNTANTTHNTVNKNKGSTVNINSDTKIEVKEKKKRGRRRKYDLSDKFYDKEYITVWLEVVNGQKVLVDFDNNVYTYDFDKPVYLGVKNIENTKITKPIKNEI